MLNLLNHSPATASSSNSAVPALQNILNSANRSEPTEESPLLHETPSSGSGIAEDLMAQIRYFLNLIKSVFRPVIQTWAFARSSLHNLSRSAESSSQASGTFSWGSASAAFFTTFINKMIEKFSVWLERLAAYRYDWQEHSRPISIESSPLLFDPIILDGIIEEFNNRLRESSREHERFIEELRSQTERLGQITRLELPQFRLPQVERLEPPQFFLEQRLDSFSRQSDRLNADIVNFTEQVDADMVNFKPLFLTHINQILNTFGAQLQQLDHNISGLLSQAWPNLVEQAPRFASSITINELITRYRTLFVQPDDNINDSQLSEQGTFATLFFLEPARGKLVELKSLSARLDSDISQLYRSQLQPTSTQQELIRRLEEQSIQRNSNLDRLEGLLFYSLADIDEEPHNLSAQPEQPSLTYINEELDGLSTQSEQLDRNINGLAAYLFPNAAITSLFASSINDLIEEFLEALFEQPANNVDGFIRLNTDSLYLQLLGSAEPVALTDGMLGRARELSEQDDPSYLQRFFSLETGFRDELLLDEFRIEPTTAIKEIFKEWNDVFGEKEDIRIVKILLGKLSQQIANDISNRINKLLGKLKKEKENNQNTLWEICVEVAKDVDKSCTDRALIGLEEIENKVRAQEAIDLGKEGGLALFKCIEQEFLMKTIDYFIDKFDRRYINRTGDRREYDPVELSLQLMLSLKKDSNLSINSDSMRFPGSANLSREEVNTIKQKILASNHKKIKYIAQSSIWISYLHKIHANEFTEALTEKTEIQNNLEDMHNNNLIKKSKDREILDARYSKKILKTGRAKTKIENDLIEKLTEDYANRISLSQNSTQPLSRNESLSSDPASLARFLA